MKYEEIEKIVNKSLEELVGGSSELFDGDEAATAIDKHFKQMQQLLKRIKSFELLVKGE